MNMPESKQDNVQKINAEILQLWKDYPRDAGPLVPKLIHNPIETDTLLFLGFNPSFPKKIPEEIKGEKNVEWHDIRCKLFELGLLVEGTKDYRQAFLWERFEKIKDVDQQKKAKELFADVHYKARRFYPKWFEKLNSVADRLGLEKNKYGHLDLYLWADANSEIIEDRVKLFAGKSIIETQKQLAIRLIKIHKPRVIVCVYKNVWNALNEHFKSEIILSDPDKFPFGQPFGQQNTIEYADARIGGFDHLVPIVACPDLPTYTRGEMTHEIIEKFILILKHCWDKRSVKGVCNS
jgi:hypothetical protein